MEKDFGKSVVKPPSPNQQGQLWDQTRLLRAFFKQVPKTSKDGVHTSSLRSLLPCLKLLYPEGIGMEQIVFVDERLHPNTFLKLFNITKLMLEKASAIAYLFQEIFMIS